jgi:hypothetical protein
MVRGCAKGVGARHPSRLGASSRRPLHKSNSGRDAAFGLGALKRRPYNSDNSDNSDNSERRASEPARKAGATHSGGKGEEAGEARRWHGSAVPLHENV